MYVSNISHDYFCGTSLLIFFCFSVSVFSDSPIMNIYYLCNGLKRLKTMKESLKNL